MIAGSKYLDWIASQGCLVCGQAAEVHHVIVGDDYGRLPKDDKLVVPLCPHHHRDTQHGIHGVLKVKHVGTRLTANQRFNMIYGVNCFKRAKRLRRKWERENEHSEM